MIAFDDIIPVLYLPVFNIRRTQTLAFQQRQRAPVGGRFVSVDETGVPKVCYAQMSKQFLRRDPFKSVLWGGRMEYRRAVAGLNVQGLKIHAREISLMRYIPG